MAEHVRIIIFRPNSAPEVTTIEPTLEAMRELVCGNLGGLRIAPTIYLHFDEEGRVFGKPPCVFVDGLGDVAVGTCLAVGVDERGESRSLDDDEAWKRPGAKKPTGVTILLMALISELGGTPARSGWACPYSS